MKAHIVMLLSNGFRPDPRVLREATSLSKAGYHLTVICWDRQAEFQASEKTEFGDLIRIQEVKTRYGAGERQLFKIPYFWKSAITKAIQAKPDMIHCHDLDTLYPGWRIKQRLNCPLIFDAHENYPALMSLYLPKVIVRLLSIFETFLIRKVDLAITASDVLGEEYRKNMSIPVVTIGNYQPLEPFNQVSAEKISQARSQLGISESDLLVAYIGGFSRNRLILPLIEAATQLSGVKVLIWGDGHQREGIEQAVADLHHVQYMGWLPADRLPLMTNAADVIYYCLAPDYPGAIYNASNTLANAMAAGKPVIGNDVGDLGRVLRQTGCGILLDQVSPDTIRQAIETLRDPLTRMQLGNAGRQAAEARYNWSVAETELVTIYDSIVNSRARLQANL